MKNILLPLELKNDRLDQKLIDIAVRQARAFQAKCWLLHVEPPDPEFIDHESGPQYIRDTLAEKFRAEHKKIQAYAEGIRAKSVEAEGLLIQGATLEMIEFEIKKLEIDLLVIGNRKYSFAETLFNKGVKDVLLGNLTIPIMLVPEKA